MKIKCLRCGFMADFTGLSVECVSGVCPNCNAWVEIPQIEEHQQDFDLSSPRNIIALEAMKVLITQGNLFRNSPVILSNQAFSIADAMIEKGTTHE